MNQVLAGGRGSDVLLDVLAFAPGRHDRQPDSQIPGVDASPESRTAASRVEGMSSTRTLVALSLLVAQNASIAILTRLSRLPRRHSSPTPGATFEPFVASTAVFVAEVVKLLVSWSVATSQRHGDALVAKKKKKDDTDEDEAAATGWPRSARLALVSAVGPGCGPELLRVSVPAVLYAVQNNLLYLALSNLDSATYSVVYQMKILSAAMFSVVLLKRHLSALKWLSLVLLTIGVALVQSDTEGGASGKQPQTTTAGVRQNRTKGLVALMAACLSSGLAGTWFEMVLKSSPSSYSTSNSNSNSKARASLWTRNLQLSVPSLVFTASAILVDASARASIARRGFFAGYDGLTWLVIINQALGGILVALAVREAGSVSKGFATSLAVVVSTATSSLVFDFVPGRLFLLGAAIVLLATALFAVAR